LKQRGLRAGAWLVASQVVNQVLRLASNLLLTRFLLPEAFGLMAVISTLLMVLNLVSDIGSGTVIVQSQRGADRDFLNTAWTLQVIRGIGLWLVALLIAGALALIQHQGWLAAGTVYGDPRLPLLISVASLVAVINGLGTVKVKLAERNLDFAKVSIIDVGVGVAAIIGMATGAYLTGSIWVLVGGSLGAAAAKVALNHLFLRGPRAAFRLETEALRELFGKGKWVVLSSMLGVIAMSGDKLLLGGLVDATTLGLYSIAVSLAGIATTTIATLLGKVVLPIFSEVVRAGGQNLGRTYRRLQQLVDLPIGLIAGFAFVASDLIVAVLYDDRYRGVAHVLTALAVGSLGLRFIVAEQIYIAMGKTSLLALAILPRALIVVIGVPVGYALWRLDGALAAVVLSQFAHWPLAIWFRTRHGLNGLLNDIVLLPATLAGLSCGWLLVRLLPMWRA
jgi:O-antigen/teichoic acid export membrane protein